MDKIEHTLTSLEVAEMIGREHNALLKTIRTFVSHMEKIAEGNSAQGDKIAVGENDPGSKDEYFKDSTYEDANGQKRPCFNVTKKGCELIAHKMNGIKGTEFTMRYIDKFHDMEETIATPKLPQNTMELLELHYQVLKEVDSKVDKAEQRIDQLDDKLEKAISDLPILGIEESRISNAIKTKGVKCLGGKESNAYKDKSVRGRLYCDMHRQLRREFGISTYKAIKRSQCDTAITIINGYAPPLVLSETIETLNNQQSLNLKGGE